LSIPKIVDIKHLELLKDEQREEARRIVREEILAEQRKEALKQLKDVYRAEERAQLEPAYEQVRIVIDVPAASDGLLIDGRKYHHGDVVEVPDHMARSMREMMQNAWFAETLAGNPNMKNYIPPRIDSFSAREVGVSIHSRSARTLPRV